MDRDASSIVRWRVRSAAACQLLEPGEPYWHDNRRRPGGAVLFQYTRTGCLSVRSGGRLLRVPPGNAVLLRFGDATAYGLDPRDRDGYSCAYASLHGAGLQAHWRELIELHGMVTPCADDLLTALLGLVAARDAPPARQAALVHAFVMRLYEGPPAQARGATERAVATVRADPCGVRSLKELAATHGISREHLARAFRARTGQPAWAFVTAARLRRAQELLADPDLGVAEVARLCGYASARVLARNLTEATGHPPSAWRR